MGWVSCWGGFTLVGGRAEHRQVLAEVQGHPARSPPERAGPDPDELAARAQLVHPRRRIRARAARQHVALPRLGGHRQSLERDQHLAQAVNAGAGRRMAVDPLPRRAGSARGPLLDRFDLFAKDRKRSAAQPAQHLGVAPLAL